eukprot:6514104-Pyramimonas_sp.AAC.1
MDVTKREQMSVQKKIFVIDTFPRDEPTYSVDGDGVNSWRRRRRALARCGRGAGYPRNTGRRGSPW